jgi:hypothetical protein
LSYEEQALALTFLGIAGGNAAQPTLFFSAGAPSHGW